MQLYVVVFPTNESLKTGSEVSLKQWSQTQFLEGHSSAEFSSNQPQITPAWKFLVANVISIMHNLLYLIEMTKSILEKQFIQLKQ